MFSVGVNTKKAKKGAKNEKKQAKGWLVGACKHGREC